MTQYHKIKINHSYFSLNPSINTKRISFKNHSKNKEIVYKLNLKNDGLVDIDNQTIRINKLIYNQDPRYVVNPLDLYKSIEKVKTFFPNLGNYLETAKNENVEKIIYHRLKNQEYENILKKKIKDLSKEKKILNGKMNEYTVELSKKEYEIDDKDSSISILGEINKINSKLNQSLEKSNILNQKNIYNNEKKIEINKIKKENSIKIEGINNNKYRKIINQNKKMIMLNLKNKEIQKIKKLNLLISKLKLEKNDILKKINNLEHQKEKLRIEKYSITQELYKYYLNILKIGKDTRNEGLSWVIKEIFLLKKKVLLSYFPSFLDHFAKIFLFKQAKNKLDLDEINGIIKLLKQELLDKGFFKDEKYNDLAKKEIKKNLTNSEIENSITSDNLEGKNIKTLAFFERKNKITKNLNLKTSFKTYQKVVLKINPNNFNSRNLTNTNYNFFEKNNTTISDLNKSTIQKKKLIEQDLLKVSVNPNSTTYSSRYQNLNKYKENDNCLDNPYFLILKNLEKYLKQKKSESKLKNNGCKDLIEQIFNLKKRQKEFKIRQEKMKKKEMDRIFNEYLRNNYFQKYKVEKNVVLSALIGEDNINNELNKQIKRAKKFFNNAKSYSLGHKEINKNYFQLDKDKHKILKTIIGDTFLGGIY